MKRILRGSSSWSSKEKQKEEEKKPKLNLPRTAEVRPCEWPSDDFLRATGIYDDFYELAKNAGLTDFLHDQREQYLLLTNIFVQNFYYYPRELPPLVEFIYMMWLRRCHYMNSAGFAKYLLRVA